MAYETAPSEAGGRSSGAKEKAGEVADQARQSTGEVAATVKEQAREVAGESRTQARHVATRIRDQLDEETWTQAQRVAEMVREWSDDLAAMADQTEVDSPVRDVVRQVAERGHRTADFLDQRGLYGVADEIRGFARRRPGLFLAGAALAGFAVGRLAKAVTKESQEETAEPSAVESSGPGPVRTPPPREEESAPSAEEP